MNPRTADDRRDVDEDRLLGLGKTPDRVRLVLGTIPMLIIAGTIEGFLSPTKTPVAIKFTVAALMFSLLIAYLSLPPKQKQSSI